MELTFAALGTYIHVDVMQVTGVGSINSLGTSMYVGSYCMYIQYLVIVCILCR